MIIRSSVIRVMLADSSSEKAKPWKWGNENIVRVK